MCLKGLCRMEDGKTGAAFNRVSRENMIFPGQSSRKALRALFASKRMRALHMHTKVICRIKYSRTKFAFDSMSGANVGFYLILA